MGRHTPLKNNFIAKTPLSLLLSRGAKSANFQTCWQIQNDSKAHILYIGKWDLETPWSTIASNGAWGGGVMANLDNSKGIIVNWWA